ncbi:MAG: histidinol-phosphatase HisJ [Calditrichaceae bacterium]
MMKCDYHIHTKLCKHAEGEMEAYVERAIEKGLKEIAFTDHIPLPDQFDIAHRMSLQEIDLYLERIFELKNQYPEIIIKAGIEADYYEGFESFLEKILSSRPFDIVIMSVHFIRGWDNGNWAFKYDFPGKSMEQIYSEYLNAVMKGIKTGLFDIVGHLDLIKSTGHPLLETNQNEVEMVLKLVNEKNMAVELNTSGLRKKIGEVYPDLSFLPLLDVNNIAVTLGSDAHKPEDTGFYFDEILAKLSEFRNLRPVVFDKRKMIKDIKI